MYKHLNAPGCRVIFSWGNFADRLWALGETFQEPRKKLKHLYQYLKNQIMLGMFEKWKIWTNLECEKNLTDLGCEKSQTNLGCEIKQTNLGCEKKQTVGESQDHLLSSVDY